MKSSDKSSLCGVLLVEHFGRDAATPVGHARGRCCISRIHSVTHQVGETVPHARVLANIRAGGGCSSRLAKLGWKSQKVDASPEARGAMRLRAEHHRGTQPAIAVLGITPPCRTAREMRLGRAHHGRVGCIYLSGIEFTSGGSNSSHRRSLLESRLTQCCYCYS